MKRTLHVNDITRPPAFWALINRHSVTRQRMTGLGTACDLRPALLWQVIAKVHARLFGSSLLYPWHNNMVWTLDQRWVRRVLP